MPCEEVKEIIPKLRPYWREASKVMRRIQSNEIRYEFEDSLQE